MNPSRTRIKMSFLVKLLVAISRVTCQINALASVLEFADSEEETNQEEKFNVLEKPSQRKYHLLLIANEIFITNQNC